MADDRGRFPPETDEQLRRRASLDNEMQADPELAEGPASGGRVAMFALAIALVLGSVFYGLNNADIPGLEKYPDFGKVIGSCSVQNDLGRMTMQCPDDAARHAAIDEFLAKNKNYEVTGFMFQKKKSK
jgi:hypothetical protein